MEADTLVHNLSLVIQWAVAPVFLLTGIAGFLAVLTSRLGRIVDRARLVQRHIDNVESDDHRQSLSTEANALWKRIGLINWAIRLLVGAALAVCGVVMSLFVGDLVSLNMGTLIATLFIASMVLIMLGLLLLLLEVSVSTSKMRQGVELS